MSEIKMRRSIPPLRTKFVIDSEVEGLRGFPTEKRDRITYFFENGVVIYKCTVCNYVGTDKNHFYNNDCKHNFITVNQLIGVK